jgi:hypothetical protein
LNTTLTYAQPLFFVSWAYRDKPEMAAQLAEAYTKAGTDNNAVVIPAGLAFARSVDQKPDINLYIADKRPPTLAHRNSEFPRSEADACVASTDFIHRNHW